MNTPARRHAWLIGAYYFFFYGAIGCLLPYIPLYYQHIGLTGEQIGLLMGLGPIVLLGSGPLWGAIGDRFNLHRWLLPIASAGAIVPIFFIPLTDNLTFLILLTIVQSFFATAIGPLMDSAALEIAASSGASFGQLRLGGSIGFTIISVAMGWLLTRVSLVWLFYSYMICMALAALVALPLPARQHYWNAPMRQGFRTLLGQPPLAFFLAAAMLIGVSASAVQFFFPLYMQSIGGDSNLVGIAGAVAAFSEMPIMFFANGVLRRVGGLWAGVALGTAAYTVRWIALSWAATPMAVMAVQALHGVSFGLFVISAVAYVESQAPPGLSATAQSLFIAATWGLGAMTGAFGGGIIFERFGPTVLFQVAGVTTLLALVFLFASRFLTERAARSAL